MGAVEEAKLLHNITKSFFKRCSLAVELLLLISKLASQYNKASITNHRLTMRGSHGETIGRLEGILREVECELLYLINDLCAVDPAAEATLPVRRLEVARHCVLAAEKALQVEAAADLVCADG